MMEQKRKRKKKAKLEFDASKIFDIAKKDERDLNLSQDAARYTARKGQAGDGSRQTSNNGGWCRTCGAVNSGACICERRTAER